MTADIRIETLDHRPLTTKLTIPVHVRNFSVWTHERPRLFAQETFDSKTAVTHVTVIRDLVETWVPLGDVGIIPEGDSVTLAYDNHPLISVHPQ